MRIVRTALFVAGVAFLVYLVLQIGTQSIGEALSRLAWWQFALLCLPHGIIMAVDTLGWRFAFARDRAPFLTLLGARVAGDALNLVTAVASVGGEAVKAWLVRHHVSYEESVPSLVIAKTTSTIAQGLFLLLGLVIARMAIDLDSQLWRSMLWLLLGESVAVGGFVLVQLTGVIAQAGRVVSALGVGGGASYAQRLDDSLRHFYRYQWPRVLVSTACHFAGWVLGGLEAFLILQALQVPLSHHRGGGRGVRGRCPFRDLPRAGQHRRAGGSQCRRLRRPGSRSRGGAGLQPRASRPSGRVDRRGTDRPRRDAFAGVGRRRPQGHAVGPCHPAVRPRA
jgi:glycosyltransferase 2 family protein